MKKEECFFLGKVTKPHGLKGDVTLWLDVDKPEDYGNIKTIYIDLKGELIEFKLKKILIRGKKSIAKFEGIDTIEQTADILSKDIYLPLDKLPQLSDTGFYYHEVIGYKMFDGDTEIGTLKAVYESSGQDLFALEIDEKEVLIPIVDNFISKIDHSKKIIILSLPEGLLDVYLNS